jgi:hypothetical protein
MYMLYQETNIKNKSQKVEDILLRYYPYRIDHITEDSLLCYYHRGITG